MPYSDMTAEESILLAVEFVGRGVPIPDDLQSCLGPCIIREIMHPETTNGNQEP